MQTNFMNKIKIFSMEQEDENNKNVVESKIRPKKHLKRRKGGASIKDEFMQKFNI